MYRDVTSVILRPRDVGSLFADMRYALRLFRRHPALIGTTVVGLALAIGVSTAVFSILNAVALRPYGIDDPSSVVKIDRLVERGSSTLWPYASFVELRERAAPTVVEASLSDRTPFGVSADMDRAHSERAMVVSGGYLAMLGGHAVMGRALGPADDRPDASVVVMLSHAFWSRRLNADVSIVGKTVWLSGTPVTVIGVLAPSFNPPGENPPSLWFTFASYGRVYNYERPIDRTSRIGVQLLARTASSVTRDAAESQMSVAASTLTPSGVQEFDAQPTRTTGVRLTRAGYRIDEADAGTMFAMLAIVTLVVGLVLTLACANVANMLLAGASARAREIGVRLAMGATGQRVIRQLITESLLIGATAGALGLLLSATMLPALVAAIGLRDTYDVHVDGSVVLFATVIALLTGLGAGLAPARHGARGDLIGVLKSQAVQSGTAPRASSTRRWFVGFQAAASMLLLVMAALFTRAAQHITHGDLGFDADKLAWTRAIFPGDAFGATAIHQYCSDALTRAKAIPGVSDAALVLYPPFGGTVAVRQRDHDGRIYKIFENQADERYLSVAGFRIVRGRGYTRDEAAANAPVALVSESLVRDFLGGKEPIGAPLSEVTGSPSKVTIIGVVADAVTWRVGGNGGGTIYQPIDPKGISAPRLLIRSTQPASFTRAIETTLQAMEPRVRIATTLISTDVDRYMNEPRVLAGLTTGVAVLAVVLAVLGLYGVTAFVVSQRAQEMSVRMAIGASASQVVRLLVADSLRPVVLGLVAGLAVALLGSRVLEAALSGISPHDPLAIGGAVVVLLVAAVSAVLIPARKSASTDPTLALRQL